MAGGVSDIPCPGKGWKRNTGTMPRAARDKRIRVILAHGGEGKYDANPMSPPGWAGSPRGADPWSFKDTPFDIIWYLVL
jgi:hypothetical protein